MLQLEANAENPPRILVLKGEIFDQRKEEIVKAVFADFMGYLNLAEGEIKNEELRDLVNLPDKQLREVGNIQTEMEEMLQICFPDSDSDPQTPLFSSSSWGMRSKTHIERSGFWYIYMANESRFRQSRRWETKLAILSVLWATPPMDLNAFSRLFPSATVTSTNSREIYNVCANHRYNLKGSCLTLLSQTLLNLIGQGINYFVLDVRIGQVLKKRGAYDVPFMNVGAIKCYLKCGFQFPFYAGNDTLEMWPSYLEREELVKMQGDTFTRKLQHGLKNLENRATEEIVKHFGFYSRAQKIKQLLFTLKCCGSLVVHG